MERNPSVSRSRVTNRMGAVGTTEGINSPIALKHPWAGGGQLEGRWPHFPTPGEVPIYCPGGWAAGTDQAGPGRTGSVPSPSPISGQSSQGHWGGSHPPSLPVPSCAPRAPCKAGLTLWVVPFTKSWFIFSPGYHMLF